MRKISDFINAFTLFYLCFPIVLFAFGWLKLYYAISLTIVLLVALIISLKSFADVELSYPPKRTWIIMGLVLLIVLIWVGFSGIGGISFQNSDHINRNAVLRDLVQYKWPVIYNYQGQKSSSPLAGHHAALIYYFVYWLPAALVGKMGGWLAANIALYLWTVIGILLSFYYLSVYLKKLSLAILVLFVFWSGLDFLGVCVKSGLPRLGEHIEWWAGYFQYSSLTTTLYWVFNQTIPIWVIIMAMLNQKNNKSLFFLYMIGLPYAPFPFVGLFPFILFWAFFQKAPMFDKKEVNRQIRWTLRERLQPLFTIQNILAPALIFVVFMLFFTSNQSQSIPNHGFIGARVLDLPDLIINYVLFCIMEYGFYALCIMTEFRSRNNFWVAVILLSIIPLYSAGIYNDFVMRASIPALLILMVYVAKYIINKRLNLALALLIIIGGITPFNEIYRSVHHTFVNYPYRLADRGYTFGIIGKIEGIDKFVAVDYQKRPFFKYLSK